MELGAFSVSLAVKNIGASQEFYEKLGFASIMGEATEKWLIMRNGDHVIGLFEGMFEKNMLTFNPGWNQSGTPVESFTDIREIQRHLKSEGVALADEVDETTEGPGSVMLMDPDGNPILLDQHV